MPRNSTVSYENFFRKAEAVHELYGRVTYERMREALGSGSMSTYKPLMDRWRKERQDKTSLGVPKALSERIDIVVRDVYKQIATLAEQDKEQEIETARKVMEQERYRADRADSHAVEVDARLNELRVQLEEREESIAKLKTDLLAAQAELATRDAKLDNTKRRLAELGTEHAIAQEQLAEMREALAEQETRGAGHVDGELREKLKTRTEMLAEARQRLRASELLAEQLQMDLSEAHKVNAQLSQSFSELVRR